VLIDNSCSSNTTFSEWSKIKHFVPQGSVLGPLSFLLYINDFLNIIASLCKLDLHAGDTSIMIANPSPSQFIERY